MKIYSFLPVSNKHSEILILGTMPSVKSLDLIQYYGNTANMFWKIIFIVFNGDFSSDYEIRKDFLLRNGIALWDVLGVCERKGSSDNVIKEEKPNDFDAFLSMHKNIKLIVFNGKNAEAFYNKHCKIYPDLQYLTMPSTSPANARKTFNQKLNEWKIINTIE